jgi:hypothetical protein
LPLLGGSVFSHDNRGCHVGGIQSVRVLLSR